jgi:hypothetical protein
MDIESDFPPAQKYETLALKDALSAAPFCGQRTDFWRPRSAKSAWKSWVLKSRLQVMK